MQRRIFEEVRGRESGEGGEIRLNPDLLSGESGVAVKQFLAANGRKFIGTVATLADRCGMEISTCSAALQRLVLCKVIRRTETGDGGIWKFFLRQKVRLTPAEVIRAAAKILEMGPFETDLKNLQGFFEKTLGAKVGKHVICSITILQMGSRFHLSVNGKVWPRCRRRACGEVLLKATDNRVVQNNVAPAPPARREQRFRWADLDWAIFVAGLFTEAKNDGFVRDLASRGPKGAVIALSRLTGEAKKVNMVSDYVDYCQWVAHEMPFDTDPLPAHFTSVPTMRCWLKETGKFSGSFSNSGYGA